MRIGRLPPTRSALVGIGIAAVVVLAILGLVIMLSGDSGGGDDAAPTTSAGPDETTGAVLDGGAVVGSGTIITETRTMGVFTGIVVAGEGEVILIQSPQPLVTLRTDDNLVQLITTDVVDGTLFIDTAERVADIDPTTGVRFEIATPNVELIAITGAGSIRATDVSTGELTITLSGAGSIDVSGVTAAELRVEATGAGLVTISGEADTQEILMEGTAGYRAGDLQSRVATVDTNTVSDVILWVTELLDASLRGVGSLSYYGTPEVVSAITGGGAFRALGEK